MNTLIHKSSKAGFSLIELVVVVLIMSVLAGVVVPRVIDRQATARDSRRLADVKAISSAVEQFYLDTGQWPVADGSGWDKSHDASFISELTNKGYLRETPKDPVNDNTYHYRYYVYNQGKYGCIGSSKFYVLGVRQFESDDFATKNPGFFKCASRNWSSDFDYVTGGGASFN
jgi:general secretion pathway protein G